MSSSALINQNEEVGKNLQGLAHQSGSYQEFFEQLTQEDKIFLKLYCQETLLFGNHLTGEKNCKICSGKMFFEHVVNQTMDKHKEIVQNMDLQIKIFEEFQKCDCCKGLVYNC